LAARAWALFWQRCTAEQLCRMRDMGTVERYLMVCARAAASGAARAAADSRAAVVLKLRYQQGLSAAAIQANRPDLFPTVADVYSAGCRVFESMRSDAVLTASGKD
jgi:hypothetical protein